MPLRGKKQPIEENPVQTAPAEERVFWQENATLSAGTLEYKKRLGEQISRLQQRQLELVQHTSDELESLRQELENGSGFEEKVEAATKPLQSQIAELQAQNAALEETLRIAEETYRSRYSQVHSTVTALKNAIRGQARSMDQQLRVFSMDTGQSIESMIASIEAAQLPTFDDGTPRVAPIATPSLISHEPKAATQHAAFEAHEAKLKQEAPVAPVETPVSVPKLKTPRRGAIRRFAVRGISVVLVAALGFGAYKAAGSFTGGSTTGTVAGVSTDSSVTSVAPAGADTSEPVYAEAQADVSFADSTWDTTTDTDFGISFQYPTNATNRVRTIGGANLWILRKDHYILNVRQDDATTLDAWQNANTAIIADYSVTKGTFKNLPALILSSIGGSNTAGTMYVVARPGVGTLSIWFKDEPITSDDGQRIKKMMDTFTFTGPNK